MLCDPRGAAGSSAPSCPSWKPWLAVRPARRVALQRALGWSLQPEVPLLRDREWGHPFPEPPPFCVRSSFTDPQGPPSLRTASNNLFHETAFPVRGES